MASTDSGLEAALDRLARTPPRDFVERRQALVAELKAAGDKQAAAAVGQAKRPTVPVWVLNTLALEDPEGLERLVQAADAVKKAQMGKGGDLAAAMAGYREAAAALTEQVGAITREGGVASTTEIFQRVENALRAAVADPEARRLLERGRLEHEPASAGFDVFSGARPTAQVIPFRRKSAAPPAGRPAGPPPTPEAVEAEARRAQEARERLDAARRVLAETEREARARQQAAEAQARHARVLRATATSAQERATAADQAATAAERTASEAADQAARAVAELETARAAVRKAAGDTG